MKAHTCIVVDDEAGAHRVLEHYISKSSDFRQIGGFYNALDAFHFLRDQPVDLIFLDVNMPEIDGFAFLRLLNHQPHIVITSAYSEYAIQGFEQNVSDYLLKPIRLERFMKALEKVKTTLQLSQLKPPAHQTIEVKADGAMHRVDLQELHYIQSIGNYVRLFTGSRSLIVHATMAGMETLLRNSTLLRVHKSYIVNMRHVSQVGSRQVSIGDLNIPVGKTYKKYLQEWNGKAPA